MADAPEPKSKKPVTTRNLTIAGAIVVLSQAITGAVGTYKAGQDISKQTTDSVNASLMVTAAQLRTEREQNFVRKSEFDKLESKIDTLATKIESQGKAFENLKGFLKARLRAKELSAIDGSGFGDGT
jgi:chromosome segregation ATPase